MLFDADTEFGKLVAADNAAAAAAAAAARAPAAALATALATALTAPAAPAATTVGVPVTPTAMVVAQPTAVDYRERFRAHILLPPKARGVIGQSAGVMANAAQINPCAANIQTMQGRLRQLANPTTHGAYAVNAFLAPLLTTALDIRPRAQDDKEKLARCWAAGWGSYKQEHAELFVNAGMLLMQELAQLSRDAYDALRKHVTDYRTLYCVSKAHFETVFNAWDQQQSARASSRTAGPALPPLSDFQDATTILSRFQCWDNGGQPGPSIQEAVRQIQATVKGTVTAAMANPGKRANLPSEEYQVKTKQRKVGDRTTIDVVTERVSSFPKIKVTTPKDTEEDQEGDWDHSAKDAIKTIGHDIIEAIQGCLIEANQAAGVAYARNTFQTQKDMRTHVNAIKNMFHICEKAGADWNAEWPIKSVSAFPDNDAEIAGHFATRYKELSSEATSSMVDNARDSMRWACRGLAISRGLLESGKAAPGVEYCRLRSAIRAKQVEIRNQELFEAVRDGVAGDGVGPAGQDDKNWMLYIRHKYSERVEALDTFCAKMGI